MCYNNDDDDTIMSCVCFTLNHKYEVVHKCLGSGRVSVGVCERKVFRKYSKNLSPIKLKLSK